MIAHMDSWVSPPYHVYAGNREAVNKILSEEYEGLPNKNAIAGQGLLGMTDRFLNKTKHSLLSIFMFAIGALLI